MTIIIPIILIILGLSNIFFPNIILQLTTELRDKSTCINQNYTTIIRLRGLFIVIISSLFMIILK